MELEFFMNKSGLQINMLLIFDIGNTNVKVAVFESGTFVRLWRIIFGINRRNRNLNTVVRIDTEFIQLSLSGMQTESHLRVVEK